MNFLYSAVISGFLYDGLKNSTKLTAKYLKKKLKDWLIDDQTIDKLTKQIDRLALNDQLSEKAIKQKLEENNHIMKLLKEIEKNSSKPSVIQNHSGTGDNIAGNKNTYNNSK